MEGSKFHDHFLKRVTQGTFLSNYFKIWPAVSEKKIFYEFLHVPIVQEATIHQSHVYGWIKISWTPVEKGHQMNIHVKLFQNLTCRFGEEDFLRISSCLYCARSPHSPEPCFWQIKILRTIFKKGHPRNISVKLFQNRTSGSRGEDF